MQLYLIATPEQQRSLGRLRPALAHMAYRLGENSTLLRQNQPIKRQEGLLVIGDTDAPVIETPSALCDAILREMGRHNYSGVVLDFEQSPTPDREHFISQLDDMLHSHKKSLYLPPTYASVSQYRTIIIDTAISGGNFRQYLEESKGQYGTIALDVQRLQMDFLLPATQGVGQPLNNAQLALLRKTYGANSFFSQELCTRYFTYQQDGQTHFILFDDGETLLQKLRLGAGLGIDVGLCVYQEVEDLLSVLFQKRLNF